MTKTAIRYERVEREAFQFLAAFRFLSYGLAVMFTQVTPILSTTRVTLLQIYVILGTLGVYTLLKVFSPIRWRERSPITYVILIGDFVACMTVVIYTGGVNSAFLLYSLVPIMTAALLFGESIALSLAAIASLTLSITHLLLSQVSERFAWIMLGPNLTILIVYTLFCFVGASVPYRINLNIRRRIERDAIIEERRRIAREMHDGVAQSLSYLNLKTGMVADSVTALSTKQALAGLDEIRKVMQDTYEDIRESIDQLSIETKSVLIVPALRKYAAEFAGRNGIQVRFDAPGSFPPLSPVAELQLLRIAQEALTNVRRHAQATEVQVSLVNTRRAVEMTIKDNGRGFKLADLEATPGSIHGLNILKERAEGLGGGLDIVAAPGQGTEVKVTLPVEKVRL